MATLTDFAGAVNVQYSWTAAQDIDGLSSPLSATGTYSVKNSWSYGDAAGQSANVFFTLEVLAGSISAQIDLFNLLVPQSNVNISFAFGKVTMLSVELITNEDASTGSTGIRVGGAASNAFDGWWSAGATQDIDTGGLPVIMGGNGTTGKTVGAGNRFLKILNLDAVNEATVRVTVFGVQNNF